MHLAEPDQSGAYVALTRRGLSRGANGSAVGQEHTSPDPLESAPRQPLWLQSWQLAGSSPERSHYEH